MTVKCEHKAHMKWRAQSRAALDALGCYLAALRAWLPGEGVVSRAWTACVSAIHCECGLWEEVHRLSAAVAREAATICS